MKALLRRLVALLGGYELYRVLERGAPTEAKPMPRAWSIRPVDQAAREALAREAEEKPRQLGGAALAQGAMFLALWNGATLLAVVLYEPLAMPWIATIWPNGAGEGMALTDIWTFARTRRKGAGEALLRASAAEVKGPLIAWTWWTNGPSLALFAKAGWRPLGWSLRVSFLPRMRWRSRIWRPPPASL